MREACLDLAGVTNLKLAVEKMVVDSVVCCFLEGDFGFTLTKCSLMTQIIDFCDVMWRSNRN